MKCCTIALHGSMSDTVQKRLFSKERKRGEVDNGVDDTRKGTKLTPGTVGGREMRSVQGFALQRE